MPMPTRERRQAAACRAAEQLVDDDHHDADRRAEPISSSRGRRRARPWRAPRSAPPAARPARSGPAPGVPAKPKAVLSRSSTGGMTSEPKITPKTSATCCRHGVAPTSWPVFRSCRLSLEMVAIAEHDRGREQRIGDQRLRRCRIAAARRTARAAAATRRARRGCRRPRPGCSRRRSGPPCSRRPRR